jgi:hypothetical protein
MQMMNYKLNITILKHLSIYHLAMYHLQFNIGKDIK